MSVAVEAEAYTKYALKIYDLLLPVLTVAFDVNLKNSFF